MDKEKLQKLLDKRMSIHKEMTKILDSADEKTWNAETKAKYEKMEADFDALTDQINKMQKHMEMEDVLNSPLREPLKSEANIGKVKHDEYKMAFEAFIMGKTLTPEFKAALNTGTNEDGGYLVPVEYQKKVLEKLYNFSNTRQISTVIQTKSTRNIPIDGEPGAFGWIDETGQYPLTNPTVGNKQLKAHKVGGIIQISEEMLQDSFVDIEEYLSKKIAIALRKAEDLALTLGDGNGKPTGYATGLAAGITLASKDSITADEVIDTFYSLSVPYRANATWRMNDQVEKVIRKLKDNQGRYIFDPAMSAGERDSLLGKPIVEDYNLPALGNVSKNVIVVGDFSYYTIADRGQMYIQKLVERYADYGLIGYRVYKREDAGRVLDEAFTAAQTPAS
jgi:HK97 family phage major capsid protein